MQFTSAHGPPPTKRRSIKLIDIDPFNPSGGHIRGAVNVFARCKWLFDRSNHPSFCCHFCHYTGNSPLPFLSLPLHGLSPSSRSYLLINNNRPSPLPDGPRGDRHPGHPPPHPPPHPPQGRVSSASSAQLAGAAYGARRSTARTRIGREPYKVEGGESS